MFPDGLPGAGLLLLRAAAGVVLVAQARAYFADWHNLPVLNMTIALLAVVTGLALLVGYLTPFAGILAALISMGTLFAWLPAPPQDLFEARLTAILASAIMAALVCMGPGAFSLDARLFGRREIVIPSSPPRKP
jgi:uncharacterized membrane protein YphA (DoxX/SURF4 family)